MGERRPSPSPRPQSLVPPVLTSTAMRRVVRPGARLMRQLPFDAKAHPDQSADPHQCRRGQRRAAQGGAARPADRRSGGRRRASGRRARLDPRPPRQVSVAALGRADCGAADRRRAAPRCCRCRREPSRRSWSRLPASAASLLLRQWQTADAPAQGMSEANQTPAAVDTLPTNPGFVIADPGSTVASPPGATDSADGGAVQDRAARLVHAAARPRRRPGCGRRRSRSTSPAPPRTLVTGVDPRVTIPRRGLATIGIPAVDPRPDRRPTSTR